MVKCFCINNILEGNVFKAFSFTDEIVNSVFEILALSEEIRSKEKCQTHIRALNKTKVVNNTRLVHLTSSAVLRKIVRKRAPLYNPWADKKEKAMLKEAQHLRLRIFRVRRV